MTNFKFRHLKWFIYYYMEFFGKAKVGTKPIRLKKQFIHGEQKHQIIKEGLQCANNLSLYTTRIIYVHFKSYSLIEYFSKIHIYCNGKRLFS